jgi:hypothetical protein
MAFMSESAKAQPNKAGAGKKIAPGVRAVQLGKRASNIPLIKPFPWSMLSFSLKQN